MDTVGAILIWLIMGIILSRVVRFLGSQFKFSEKIEKLYRKIFRKSEQE